jgi:hypothetical protein
VASVALSILLVAIGIYRGDESAAPLRFVVRHLLKQLKRRHPERLRHPVEERQIDADGDAVVEAARGVGGDVGLLGQLLA